LEAYKSVVTISGSIFWFLIWNIHNIDFLQFLERVISALKRPPIVSIQDFHSTRSQYRKLVTRDRTRSHLFKTGTRQTCGNDACFYWWISDDTTCRLRMRVSHRLQEYVRSRCGDWWWKRRVEVLLWRATLARSSNTWDKREREVR